MIKLEEKIQIERKTNKVVFLNAKKGELKTKGIKEGAILETVENKITNVHLDNIRASLKGNISVICTGQLGGEPFTFELKNDDFLSYLGEITISEKNIRSDFAIYFSGLVSYVVPTKVEEYRNVYEKAILAPIKAEKEKAEKKAKEKAAKDYTEKAFYGVNVGDVVKLNDKQFAIYLSDMNFSYYRASGEKNLHHEKAGYGFFLVPDLENLRNVNHYKQAILPFVDKVETMNIHVDLDDLFAGFMDDEHYIIMKCADSPWAKGMTRDIKRRRTIKVFHNLLFYKTSKATILGKNIKEFNRLMSGHKRLYDYETTYTQFTI